MSNYTFKQNRSKFYIKVFENNDNITISTNEFTMCLIKKYQRLIEGLSPTGWKKSDRYNDLYNLWIPIDNVNYTIFNVFLEWAERCNSCIWLKLNRYTKDSFDENILDFCICSDWNYNFDGISGRTEIGEIEYNMKYGGTFSNNDCETIERYLKKCLSCIDNLYGNVLVTTIPATKEKQNKLSWIIAKYVAEELEADFLGTTLLKDKPQMKNLCVSDKIREWKNIYKTEGEIELSIDTDLAYNLSESTVIIVDDLYQSGASMLCYAEYLKSLGVSNILGIALVKSLKDSDNTL